MDSSLILFESDSYSNIKETELFIEQTQTRTYFNSILDILNNEGHIGSELQLLIISGNNVRQRVAQLLGKFAEAVLVNRCNNDDSYNSFYAHKARLARRQNDAYIKRFRAIGTGLKRTDNHPEYSRYYQPNDTQRDVLWVDKRIPISQLMVPNISGVDAGLQLKLSYDWENIKSDIVFYHYPILYFDMNNDWSDLDEFIRNKKSEDINPLLNLWHRVNLIEQNDFTEDIKQELRWFEGVLIDLLEGRKSVQYIIDMAKRENMVDVGHAITATQNATGHVIILK